MNKIRLLAIDLDGTLLTGQKKILPEVRSAVREAQAADVLVVLASGRIWPSMARFADQLELSGPSICGNGTDCRLSPESSFYTVPLPSGVLENIVEYADENGLHLNIYTADSLYFLRESAWGDLYRSRAETVIPKTLPSDFSKLECLKALIVDEPGRASEHAITVLGRMPGIAIRATESEPEYIEFMDVNATKGHALKRLAAELNVDQAEIAAIGDYLNDHEMLEFARLSGAIGNAHPTILAMAKVKVSDNESGGVAEFIRQFVLQQ